MSEALIEAIARAICASGWDDAVYIDQYWRQETISAAAALSAIRSAPLAARVAFAKEIAGDDYVVTPFEPNEAMKRAAFGPIMEGGRGGPITADFLRQSNAIMTFKKMLEAAKKSPLPAPPATKDETK